MKKYIFLFTLLSASLSWSQCWQNAALGWSYCITQSADGSLYSFGTTGWGQLGNPASSGPTHTQINDDTDWTKFSAARDHVLALKSDGSMWAWGRNAHGQLGNNTSGDATSSAVPIVVGTQNDWASIATGNDHCLAIKTNGTLWAWGSNNYGRLGDNTMIERRIPTRIGLESNWESVSAGYDHSIAIRTDGSMWSWGSNYNGQLVLGGTTLIYERIKPFRVGLANDWAYVDAGDSHNVALKDDSTLWVGGNNNNGQLGLGTTANTNVMMQVGTDTWTAVAAGSLHTVAIKSDGTLWTWGNNFYGQLGDNTVIDSNIPIQIGTDTDWNFVAAGLDMSMAMKTNGIIYTWGASNNGQLGRPYNFIDNHYPVAISCESLKAEQFADNGNLILSPNPAKDVLNIQTKTGEKIDKIIISDISGKAVLNSPENTNINVAQLQQGVYFIKIYSKENVYSSKFLKI